MDPHRCCGDEEEEEPCARWVLPAKYMPKIQHMLNGCGQSQSASYTEALAAETQRLFEIHSKQLLRKDAAACCKRLRVWVLPMHVAHEDTATEVPRYVELMVGEMHPVLLFMRQLGVRQVNTQTVADGALTLLTIFKDTPGPPVRLLVHTQSHCTVRVRQQQKEQEPEILVTTRLLQSALPRCICLLDLYECSHCGAPDARHLCGCCRVFEMRVRFCSRECQRAAWPAHKRQCGVRSVAHMLHRAIDA